jgi:polyphosphate kinase
MAIKKKIINREISWLSFNERVLQEAIDSNVPLVERFRFLGIFSNNLDEFFKVRVATIKRMIDVEESTGLKNKDKPKKILNSIQQKVILLQQKFEQTYQDLIAELAKQDIHIIREDNLNEEQSAYVRKYFQDEVLSVITPIMLHNVKQFPHLRDKSIYLAIKLTSSEERIEPEFALIEIPSDEIGRFVVLPPSGNKHFIILLDNVIRHCLDEIFGIFQYDHFEAYTIKLTRDAELDIDNDLTKSFLEIIDTSVSDRKSGQPVRFVYDSSIPLDLLEYLKAKLQIDEEDNLIPGGRYHNFKDYMKFPNLGGPELVYTPTPPMPHPMIQPHKSIIEVIKQKDLLLHVPYQKFGHYINLLREAAIDPEVKSVSMTLYRVAPNSRVINALTSAAMNGKKVTVVIELQARFDEKSNIHWARVLEEAGARVLFGLPGLKVHSKLSLITRKEGKRIAKYASVGTGNFHEGTAFVYGDLALLTHDPRITEEVEKVFNFFEATYKTFKYKHLLVSPLYMRSRFYNLIDNEIKNARAGKKAYILLKINSLVDKDIVKKLYQANAAGVKIKAIIRGMCSLTPGVPGLSENIEVISIVDKFLEHARIFVFCNDNDEKYYISSADWMPRNLDHRIEVACPIYDPVLQQEIRDIMEIQFRDNVKARIINDVQDNSYRAPSGERKVQSQMELYKYYQGK